MGKKESRMRGLCPSNIDPSIPLDLVNLLRSAITQSNDIWDHRQPEVKDETPYSIYKETAKSLQSKLGSTFECIASGKAFRPEFLEELRMTLEEGVPRTNGGLIAEKVKEELKQMAGGGN